MKAKEIISKFVTLGLISGFVYNTTCLFLDLLTPEISTKIVSDHRMSSEDKIASFPDITFCPIAYDLNSVPLITGKSGHNMQDLENHLPPLKYMIGFIQRGHITYDLDDQVEADKYELEPYVFNHD